MQVTLKRVDNLNFVATTQSGHQVVMDGGEGGWR